MINITKAVPSVVEKYLAHYGLDLSGDLKAQAERLAEHVEAEVDEDHIVDCQECGAPTDDRIEVCVLCGVGGDIADDAGEEMQTEVDPSPKKPKPKAKDKKARKPRKPQQLVKIEGGGQATPAAIAQAGAKLDTKVREYRALRSELVKGFWKIGHKLLEIYEHSLHRARHDNWKAFTAAELNISVSFSYKLMDIALLFTEHDVEVVGVSKLSYMVQLETEEREKLLIRVKTNNTPFTRVREEVLALASGKPRRRTGRSERSQKAVAVGTQSLINKGKQGKQSKKRLVAASVEPGTVRLKMLVKPVKDAESVRAHTVEEEPWCQEETVDGMVTTYKLVSTDSGLILHVTRKAVSS